MVSVGPSECHLRHDAYRPELRVGTPQDDKLKIHVSDDAVLHTARPIHAVMLPTMETIKMHSFSLAGSTTSRRVIICVSSRVGFINNI